MKKAILTVVLPLLLIWVAVSWLMPGWLGLAQKDVVFLRVALLALGVIGALTFLWFRRGNTETASEDKPAAADDVEVIFLEASRRLRDARLLKGRQNELPAVLMLGDARSAKTTSVLRSGLDPELLAGQAFADDSVTSTRTANIWLARKTLLLDPGSALLEDVAGWRAFVHHLAPAFTSAFGKQERAARSAVVCLSCEAFLEPNATEYLGRKARQIREQLAEIARTLGVSLPVYVLFTKLDRLPYFPEYVANLNEGEAAEVLGVTLRFENASTERQAQRISADFSNVHAALCERRLPYLEREHDQAKAAAVYEFPREFGKLRPLVTQFLVDLCRPSQLEANPVLRGFYFTGVRAVTVSDIVPAPVIPAAAPAFDPAATSVFQQPRRALEEQVSQRSGSRRVPQWAFLPRVFPQIVLADRSAHESSKSSVKTSAARRAIFVALSALGAMVLAAWTISFVANYRLATRAEQVVQAAKFLRPAGNGMVTQPDMQHLTEARSMAATLGKYEENGAPWHMRWGLYTGHSLYEPVHRAWCGAFERLLLAPTQTELLTLLGNPKNAGGDYGSVYNGLKAYLITTSYPAKSSRPFLAAVLTEHWPGARSQRDELDAAHREFDFYAAELAGGRTCPSSEPDPRALAVSREYLKNRSAAVPVYQEILSKMDRQPPLVFNSLYPGSAAVVRNEFPVPAAFTKSDWSATRSEIGKASRYLAGDDWVLGQGALQNVDQNALKQELEGRYRADMIRTWREYLRHTSVTRFANIKDAADKLRILSSNQSPLLELLCLASENTTVDDKTVKDLFQPPQALTPPGCTNHWSSAANEAYMNGLIGLQASLSTLSTDEGNETLRNDALTKATVAGQTVSTISRNFTPDMAGGVDAATVAILEAPIQYVQTLIAGVPKQQANGAAHAFCSEFDGLMRKFPFNPSQAAPAASVEEFDQIFKPGSGALWKLAQDNFQRSVTLIGATFSAKPGADPAPNPAFLNFLNQAAAVSNAFYHGGQQLQLAFDLEVVPDQDIESVSLTMNGQTLNFSKGGGALQHFVWPGNGPQEAKMRVKFAGGSEFDYPSYSGPWAVFRFFAYSDQWTDRGSGYEIEKSLKTAGGVLTVPATGHPATVRLHVETGNAPMVLRPGYFSRLHCVSTAVQ